MADGASRRRPVQEWLGSSDAGLANPAKQCTYLCAVEWGPLAVPPPQCGSTGSLPPAF